MRQRKHVRRTLGMALAASMTLSLCSVPAMAEENSEGTFDITGCVLSEPHSIDPNISTGTDQRFYQVHMWEGLMKYSVGEELAGTYDSMYLTTTEPGQAESYEVSEDELTYTFHLRDDIYWSDGEPVTAQDFVYSWQRIVDPELASSNGNIFNEIVLNATEINSGEMDPSELGVEAVDDKTFVVTLENACPYFLELCVDPRLSPIRQDVVEEYGNEWTEASNIVCNGPYTMTEWVHDGYIRLEKNEQYYNYEALGPDSITWYMNDSETAILAAYQSGEYDFMTSIPTDQISTLADSGDLFTNDKIGLYYLYLNVNHITDWRVRAAITLAIDRQNIVENVTQGGENPATGIESAGITTYDGKLWTEEVGSPMTAWLQEMYPDYDLTNYEECCELAMELLAEAEAEGYDTGVTLDYEYNTSESHKAIGEAIQSDLSGVLGIDITLNNSDSSGYTANLALGEFDIGRLGYTISFDDPIGYLDLFGTNGSFEYAGWSSSEYDELVAQAKQIEDGAERDEVMKEAEALMFSENGFSICPLYYYVFNYCMDDTIGNVGYTTLGFCTFAYATQK